MATDLWNDPKTLATMRPNEPRVFSTYVRDFRLVCHERVLRDAPPTGVALFGFVRRSASVSQVQLHAAWGDGPVDAWLAVPALAGALRVVHTSVVQKLPPGYDYDGIAEWRFANAEAVRAAFGASKLHGQQPAACGAIADLERSTFMFTQVSHRDP